MPVVPNRLLFSSRYLLFLLACFLTFLLYPLNFLDMDMEEMVSLEQWANPPFNQAPCLVSLWALEA